LRIAMTFFPKNATLTMPMTQQITMPIDLLFFFQGTFPPAEVHTHAQYHHHAQQQSNNCNTSSFATSWWLLLRIGLSRVCFQRHVASSSCSLNRFARSWGRCASFLRFRRSILHRTCQLVYGGHNVQLRMHVGSFLPRVGFSHGLRLVNVKHVIVCLCAECVHVHTRDRFQRVSQGPRRPLALAPNGGVGHIVSRRINGLN